MNIRYLKKMGFKLQPDDTVMEPCYFLRLSYQEAIYLEHLVKDLILEERRLERQRQVRKIEVTQLEA